MKQFALFIFILCSILVGCAGTSEPAPTPEPLKCDNGGLLDGPEGSRLLVECNRDVPNPPDTCERQAPGDYVCNIYHTSEADCESFPGLCKPPQ
jgi:hypothetical protein